MEKQLEGDIGCQKMWKENVSFTFFVPRTIPVI